MFLRCSFPIINSKTLIVSVEMAPLASAARSDCVRRPIGLRTGDDDFCKRVTIVRTTFCTGKAHTSFCRQWA